MYLCDRRESSKRFVSQKGKTLIGKSSKEWSVIVVGWLVITQNTARWGKSAIITDNPVTSLGIVLTGRGREQAHLQRKYKLWMQHLLVLDQIEVGKLPWKVLISTFDFLIRILFDSGASHPFISGSLFDCLHSNISLVVDLIVVSNLIWGSAHLSMVCRGLKFFILGVEFDCNAGIFRVWDDFENGLGIHFWNNIRLREESR